MQIRPDTPADYDAVRDVVQAAFATMPYSSHTEQHIVAALRAANALAISLVAETDEIVGYVACSSVHIDGKPSDWFGLGPVAVRPDRQAQGIGSALVRACIAQLHAQGAGGIVLLGEPNYYRRFGFTARPELTLPDVPASHFLCLLLNGKLPSGAITYHPAFSATA